MMRTMLGLEGTIHRADGSIVKGNGKRVLHFGPVKSWRAGDIDGSLQVWGKAASFCLEMQLKAKNEKCQSCFREAGM